MANPREAVKKSGRVMYSHPDFLWHTSLATTSGQYDFWDYSLRESLFLSPKYLSNLLRGLTGQNTQHIHARLPAKAKKKLCTPTLTVGEIACELGFEHMQPFGKLFKAKTNLSPIEFRASFT